MTIETNFTQPILREYAEVEPYVSLNPSEVIAEEKVKVEFEDRLERLERQIQEYASKRSEGSP